jgi:hypothetical protein
MSTMTGATDRDFHARPNIALAFPALPNPTARSVSSRVDQHLAVSRLLAQSTDFWRRLYLCPKARE